MATTERRDPSKGRAPFFMCLLAALLLVALSALAAVYLNARRTDLFEQALLEHVNADSLQTDEASLLRFARETMDYLLGKTDMWQPDISILGLRDFIPHSFVRHMGTVRGWALTIPTVLLLGAAVEALLLLPLGFRRQGLRWSGWYLGAALPLLLMAAAGMWAFFDFDAMWGFLHRTLIPDGIFPAGEPVMLLFPESLFAAYLPRILGLFALFCAVILLLPPAVSAISQRLTKASR